jgi:catechol 2,3-dioxygenase-like lactoylglutathione lyase family enzyme
VSADQKPIPIGPISPWFIVADLARAIRFYEDKLGFDTRYLGPEGDPFFAVVGRGPVELHLKEIDPDVRPIPNATRHPDAPWDAFVSVRDPDALAAEFAGRGLQLHSAVADRDDGLRGFEVRDSEGYTLYFGCVKS